MAKPIGPKKAHRYSDAFKATAVKLSQLSGVQVQNVAEALALKAYIRFYNHHRLHSGIDYHTPEEYERLVP